MKKGWLFNIAVVIICFWQTSCENSPQVFSVNNFSMGHDNDRERIGIKSIDVEGITGHWVGLRHEIAVNLTNGVNGLTLYSVALMDTAASKDSGTTWFDIDFMTVSGRPYIEVIDRGVKSGHSFNLVLSTYSRLNKLTRDTIIIQMQNSEFTHNWFKTRGYQYFQTAEEKTREDHAIYLTEDLPRLAAALKELYHIPQAFLVADTLVRKR